MRRRQGLVIALVAALLAGCTAEKAVRSTAWLNRFRWGGTPQGPDVVQIDVAVLERPVGDLYINQGLWAFADEQVVALESKAVLEDNGFRIGQIGGITPAELQTLLTSERSCALLPRPTPDFSGWMFQQERPVERYPTLGWEVNLSPNEYIVVGARLERPHTLGHRFFVHPDEPNPVQRLLVIRTGRTTAEDPSLPATAEETNGYWTPPLASQAAWSSARGTSH
jgi:hypothetical protein